jgi:hypothetical protein
MIQYKISIVIISLLSLFLCDMIHAQNMESLEEAFRSFEYEKVIELANQLFESEDSLENHKKIEILRMQAIAAYSLDQEIDAEKIFLRILDLDKSFTLDEQETSPKIIDFFEKVKLSYEPKEALEQPEPEPKIDSTFYFYRNALARSFLLPGWGHFYLDQKSKALLLGIPASAGLVTGIYYIFLTSGREKEYLNETNELKIDDRYNAYNSAYKVRNALFVSYALIWIYCQYDLLKNGEQYIHVKKNLIVYPFINQDYIPQIALRINF